MLAELRVRDFAIVSNLAIDFIEGLNLLTGETGAGKSIIVDALSMFIVPRAPMDLIKAGAKEAQVEAIFYDVGHPLLNELSINADEGLILRRVISSQGRTRAYINDTPVNVQTLTTVGGSLIAIHGQHEHQGLLRRETHLDILDRFASIDARLREFSALYERTRGLRQQLEALRQGMRERSQREEFLSYQIREITDINPKANEMEGLVDEYKRLSNAVRLRELAEEAYELLYKSDEAALSTLQRALTAVSQIRELDRSAEEVQELLSSAIAITSDAAAMLRDRKDDYEANPHRLEQVAERIDTLKRLLKKYGDTLEDVLRYRDRAREELAVLQASVENEAALEAELNGLEEGLRSEAAELSRIRQEAAGEMEALMIDELKGLGFNNPTFKVQVLQREGLTARGIDEVEFLFSANPGEPPRPLNKIASGGELSRLMLALKVITLRPNEKTDYHEPSTLIFDEVDAGIGGVTALQVGRRLKSIASHYQTLCITHLPQIAALADNHLMIEKRPDREGTLVTIRALDLEGRKAEIARMLSGTVTESSLRHAEELLKGGM